MVTMANVLIVVKTQASRLSHIIVKVNVSELVTYITRGANVYTVDFLNGRAANRILGNYCSACSEYRTEAKSGHGRLKCWGASSFDDFCLECFEGGLGGSDL